MAEERVLYWVSRTCIHCTESVTRVQSYAAATSCILLCKECMPLQGSGSTPAWRVMITLAEKDIQYTSKQCDFSKSEARELMLCECVVLLATFHL